MTDVAELGLKADATSIDRADRSLDKLSRTARKTETATERMNRENMQAVRQYQEMQRGMQGVLGVMGRITAIGAGLFGGIKLTSLVKDVALANSRFEQMGTVMEVVGRNIGLNANEVSRYAKEVQGMGITMNESRQTVISMIQAQLDLSKASGLARLSQDAAVIANINSSEALGRLIYGLKSAQVEVLRTMGLNVNFEDGYKKLAVQIGKNQTELTEAEKAQARLNQVMEAGKLIAGSYEASMQSASKQLGSTQRYLDDLQVLWGEAFSVVTRDLIFGYSDALKELLTTTQKLKDDGTLEEWSHDLADGLTTAIDVATLAGAVMLSRFAGPAVAAYTKAGAAQAKYLSQLAAGNVVTLNSAKADQQKAVAANAMAVADLNVAKTNAQRAASEVAAYKAVVESTRAEIALEQIRMKAQISAEGRRLSINRMVVARQELAAATMALTRIEQQHAAAMAGVATAETAAAASATRLAAAQSAATLSARAATVAMSALRGVMAFFGGPVGIALTAASAMYIFRDELFKSKTPTSDLAEEVDRLIESMKGVGKTSAELKIQELTTKIAENNIELDGMIERGGRMKTAYKNQRNAILQENKALQELIEKLQQATSSTKEYDNALDDLIRRMGMEIEAEAESLRQSKEQKDAIERIIKGLKEKNIEITRGEKELIKYQLQQNKATDAEIETALALYDSTDAWEKLIDAVGEDLKIQQKWNSAHKDTIEATKLEISQLTKIIAARKVGADAVREVNKQIFIENALREDAAQKIKDQWEEYTRLLGVLYDLQYENDKIKTQAEVLAESWQEALNRIDNAFVEMWKSAFKGFEEFADALKDAFIQLLADLAHRATTQKILISLGLDYDGKGSPGDTKSLSDIASLKSLTDFLASNPFEGIEDLLTGSSPILSELGMRLGDLSVMDVGLAALAGYAGNYLGSEIGQSLFGKEAESAIGATLGGIVGAIWGPLGSGIGATLGALIDTAFGGDGYARQAFGANVHPMMAGQQSTGYNVMGASGLNYQGMIEGDQDPTIANQFADILASTDTAITTLAAFLGADAFGRLEGQSLPGSNSQGRWGPSFFGSLDGSSLEDALAAFEDTLVARFRNLTKVVIDLEAIREMSMEGEALGDTIFRVIGQLTTVNQTFDALGLSVYELNTQGLAASDALVTAFGGLESFTSATSAYYQNFYTEQERAAAINQQLLETFQSLNIQTPTTNSEFRAIVESLDLTTTSGQATFATLMSIAPAFSQMTTAIETEINSLTGSIDQLNLRWMTADELLVMANQDLADFNTQMGLTGPNAIASKDGLMDFLYGLDLTTESGREAANAALGVADALDVIADAAEDARQQMISDVTDSAGGFLSDYNKTLSDRADLEQSLIDINKEIEDQVKAVEEASQPLSSVSEAVYDIASSVDTLNYSSSQLKGWADSILGTVDQLLLGDLSPLTNQQKFLEAQSQFAREQVRFSETGDASGLVAAAQTFLKENQAFNASGPAGNAIFQEVVSYLRDTGIELLSESERAQKWENEQKALLEGQQRATELARQAQEQADLNAQRDAKVALEQSKLDQLIQEKIAIEEALQTSYAIDADQILKDQLQNLVDMNTGLLSIEELLAVLPTDMANEISGILNPEMSEVPGFASGGRYGGGLAVVGEEGPEIIDFNNGGYVHNASDSANMMSGSALIPALEKISSRIEKLEKTVSDVGGKQVTATNEVTRATEDVGRKVNRNKVTTPSGS